MKTNLLFILISLILITISANATPTPDNPPTKEEIIIESTDYNPIRQRSALPTVTSFYFGTQLEFIFNHNIGVVKISIYQPNGTLITESIIDTHFQSNEFINLPLGISQFIIEIEGEGYWGYGGRSF